MSALANPMPDPNDDAPSPVMYTITPSDAETDEEVQEHKNPSPDQTRGMEHPGRHNPLSDAHFAQLERINALAKPIERAGAYAKFSGWTTLLAGALSLPMAIGNTPMLVFCVLLAGIGTRELTLRRRLVSLDAAAPRKLAINQLLLGGLLVCYAIFMLFSAPAQGVVESAMQSDPMLQSTPEIGSMLEDMTRLERVATELMYIGMILVAIFVQGGTSGYYALKGRSLRRLHKQSPAWCVRVYQCLNS